LICGRKSKLFFHSAKKFFKKIIYILNINIFAELCTKY